MSNKKSSRPPRPTPQKPPAKKKAPIAWIIGGALGLALVITIAISIADSESSSTASIEIGSPALDGTPLPVFDQNVADPTIGTAIPSVVGTDFDGNPITIGPDQGPAGIVFLAHWCGACQGEVPEVQEWLDGGATPASPIYSVLTSIDSSRPNYPPWSWLDREGWTTPVLVDDAAGSVMQAFGGSAFPYWVFFDGDGNVVGRVVGAIGADAVAEILEFTATS